MRLRFSINKALIVLLAPGAAQNMGAQSTQMEAAAKQMEQTESAMASSIQTQMETFRKPGSQGAGTSGGFFVTESSLHSAAEDTVTADCDALSPLRIESLVTEAALTQHVDADLVRAVIRQESGGRPCAVSPNGALGLMQLMPGTAEDLGVADPLDAEANVLGGAKFLRKLLDRYDGDLNRTLGAYNAGPARVDESQGVPPFPETTNYVDSILDALRNASAPH